MTFTLGVADAADFALGTTSILLAAALVYVTYILARYTRTLAHATEGLEAIEERRDHAEARRRRIAGLKRKIQIVDLRARKRKAIPGEATGARIIFATTVL